MPQRSDQPPVPPATGTFLVHRWLPACAGIALVAVLVQQAGFREILHVAKSLPVTHILATFVLLQVLIAAGGFNVWILLQTRTRFPFLTYLRVYTRAWAIGLLFPGQVGDATQIWMLRRFSISAIDTATVYVADKAISLIVTVVLAAFGLKRLTAHISPALSTEQWRLSPALLTAITTVFVAGVLFGLRTSLAARLITLVRRIVTALRQLASQPTALAINFSVTICKWGLTGLCYYIAFDASGIRLRFEDAVVLPALCSLAGYLPVSFGGLGTVEVLAVAVFSSAGIAAPSVLTVYLLLRVLQAASAATALTTLHLFPIQAHTSEADIHVTS